MKHQQADILKKTSFCLILLFFGLMSASVTHAEPYTFVTKWGSGGAGPGLFSSPWGVAVDSSGNVYVADTSNERIQKFDNNGTYITQWGGGGPGAGTFYSPHGVAVDQLSGSVYVADTSNQFIQKFNSAGVYITQWGGGGASNGTFSNPHGVAVDSLGNVYVADTDNNRIQKFDSSGTFITKWGSLGAGDGQFSGPYAVAADSFGNVYVADTFNNRIQKFDSNGNYITQWGSFGTGDGQLYSPHGVAVDPLGNVYVGDTDNQRIQKFAGSCQIRSLTIVKSASPATYFAVGQNITYTYTVTNSGNVNITGPINVTDSILGIVNITAGDLIPGQTVTGTADYTITQADINAGSVTNAAFATGTFGNNTITSNTDNETVTAVQCPCAFPALIIGKSASPKIYNTVGQNITYTYTVTNSGDVNITGPINVTDSILGIVNITAGDLIPGQTVTGTANYTITQADINSGSVTNAAHATGTFGNNTTTSNTDNETVTAVQGPSAFPALIIGKSASPKIYNTVGQNITYTYTVTNSGNVNITGPINVTDSILGIVNITAGDLIPGQTVTGAANYTITQADINSGSVTNAAHATGTFGNNTTTSNTDNETVTAVKGPSAFPALIIGKSASPKIYNTVGQNITYTYTVTNSGNVNITGPINVTDSILGIVNITAGDLIPGQTVTGAANYTITQADINSGSVTNAAHATGTFGNNTTTSNTDNETVTAVQGPSAFPALIIGKSASPKIYNTVGQNITYTYTVTNSGNVNITGPINVTDSI